MERLALSLWRGEKIRRVIPLLLARGETSMSKASIDPNSDGLSVTVLLTRLAELSHEQALVLDELVTALNALRSAAPTAP
jgi:hypothetical protein